MTKVPFSKKIDFFIFGNILKWFYPEYYVSKYSSKKYYKIFLHYLIPQKLFWLNGSVKWPVHFTSTILSSQNIKKGILCDPGDNPNVYIEANNGIVFGSNVGIGTGTKILSSIHSHDNHSLYDVSPPIIIGNNVFIGANSIILRGINIGDNVVVGAGSIVTKDIPSNSIALGNPCKVVKKKGPYIENLSKIEFNRKVPNKYLTFLNGFN